MNLSDLRKGVIYLCLFTIFAQSLLHIHHNTSSKYIEPRNRYAYVSLLCDDIMLDSALVLGTSLRNAKTSYPFHILTLPTVTSNARKELLHRESGIESLIDLDMLENPHKLTEIDKVLNKQCRYHKLQLWTLTQYTKIIFLDIDVMVVQNIDELFEKPEFSAVLDVGGVVNTGVFVAEPSLETYNDMLSSYKTVKSYNRGDQGFINWYFTNRTRKQIHYLPSEYNVVSWYKDYSIYPKIRSRMKVIHFTAESKPWSFYYMSHKYWERNIDGGLFYKWKKMYEIMKKTIREEDAYDLSGYKLIATQQSNRGTAHIQHLASINSICDREWPHKNRAMDKFSLLFGTFGQAERIDLLIRLITYYQSSEYLHSIFVIWHNPNATIPAELKAISVTFNKKLTKNKNMKIFITQTKQDSLNNRFIRPQFLHTRAVYIADEDVRIPVADLDAGFRVWQSNTERLVGFFPRAHATVNENTFEYIVLPHRKTDKYSIVLTKGMFTDSLFLDMYTCLLPPTIHAYVNLVHNCEDIAYNMMVSGITGKAPLAIYSVPTEYGINNGISNNPNHTKVQSNCLADLYQLFHSSMPLLYNDHMIYRYHSRYIKFIRALPSEWQ